MFKKIVTSVLLTIWLSSLALTGYRIFEPKQAASIQETTVLAVVDNNQVLANRMMLNSTAGSTTEPVTSNENTLSAKEAEEFTEEIHYFYFCTVGNPDCDFVNEYVLKPLAAELKVDKIEVLEYVDIASLSSDWTPARLKEEWNIETVPAFVATKYTSLNTKEIISVHQWKSDSPIDSLSLKTWMIANEIWTGHIEDVGELIEQPNQ